MKIQQHDGVVVDAAVIAAGLRRASARGKGVAGEREAPRLGVRLPSLPPPLYRPHGGRRPWRWDLPRGRRPRGVECPPRQVEAPPTLEFPTLGAGGPKGGTPAHYGLVPLRTSAHGALRDGWPQPVDPRDPSGSPGTIPVTPNLSRWPKLHFLYIILHLRAIPELLVTSRISSGTPNNFWITAYSYLYNPSVTEP